MCRCQILSPNNWSKAVTVAHTCFQLNVLWRLVLACRKSVEKALVSRPTLADYPPLQLVSLACHTEALGRQLQRSSEQSSALRRSVESRTFSESCPASHRQVHRFTSRPLHAHWFTSRPLHAHWFTSRPLHAYWILALTQSIDEMHYLKQCIQYFTIYHCTVHILICTSYLDSKRVP